MEIVTDINIAQKTVKRLVKRLETEPVDICPGYNSGLILPSDIPLGIIITKSIDELLPLCKFDKQSDLSVFFMVYPAGKFKPLFEISLKKSGQYVYKNNQKFVNPPQFYDLFNKVWQIQTTKIKTSEESGSNLADIRTVKIQNIILDYFEKNNIIVPNQIIR